MDFDHHLLAFAKLAGGMLIAMLIGASATVGVKMIDVFFTIWTN
jgi:hypothetical protein